MEQLLNHWGYYLLLLASLFETAPLVGMLIPGQTLVIAGGFFVKLGILHFAPLIFIVSIGAILGDTIGYLIGRKYGYRFIAKYGKYFFLKESNFEKVQKLMHGHTGKSLIIGRFNSITRAIAPLIAGSSKVDAKKFFLYNIVGGILWAFAFVMLGYIFGQSYEIASKYVGSLFFIAVILSVIIVYIYRFINKQQHLFKKYHLYALSICIISLYAFSEIADEVFEKGFIVNIDQWVNTNVQLLWNPLLNAIMIFITNIGGLINIITLSIALFAGLMMAKKKYNAALLLLGMGGGILTVEIIKSIGERLRPDNSLIQVSDYSFPSGHTTMSTIFFSLLLYSFKDDIKNPILKKLFIFGCIALFVLIGFSRIYLNVHWFSDVMAGFSLGLFWLTLLILIFKVTIFLAKLRKKDLPKKS
jgi:undecaprenyl-diphosphatase